MRRWRCVGRVGVPTADNRLLLDVHAPEHLVPVNLPKRSLADLGHGNLRIVATVSVRVRGDRIEAKLPYRLRHATPAVLGGRNSIELDDGRITIAGGTVRSLGGGPSAWTKEHLRG